MTSVLFLNGPPRCGKDTVGRIITNKVPGARVVKMAAALKVATHALFYALQGDCDEQMPAIASNIELFEHCKERPHPTFFHKTPREAYIAVSELLCKPMFGNAFFGTILAGEIMRTRGVPLWVITDSGFAHEAEPIIRSVGRSECALVRIHRDGCDFSRDSRSYIDLDVPTKLDLNNNGTLDDLTYLVRTAVLGQVAG